MGVHLPDNNHNTTKNLKQASNFSPSKGTSSKLSSLEVFIINELGGVRVDEKEGSSPGFISLPINEDKAKSTPQLDFEVVQEDKFKEYCSAIDSKYIFLGSVNTPGSVKIIKQSDSSRYFSIGRKKIKGKIFKRLGSWTNCPGLMLTLTFDPGLISRQDAWKQVGKLRRQFINNVNRWRKRQKRPMPKAKYLMVIEEQKKKTHYPHVHLVFPYLRYLAPIKVLNDLWGQASNSVDLKYKDSLSPVSYICKYITKMDGWSDLALSYIWTERTRLYSMSTDYVLPDYSDKRVPEWVFRKTMNRDQVQGFIRYGGYDSLAISDQLTRELINTS